MGREKIREHCKTRHWNITSGDHSSQMEILLDTFAETAYKQICMLSNITEISQVIQRRECVKLWFLTSKSKSKHGKHVQQMNGVPFGE